MKKQKLRTGMQVEQRNGNRMVVMLDTAKGDVLCDIDNDEWYWFKYITDNLLNVDGHTNTDIVRVFENQLPNQYISRKMDDEYCIWEREEETFNINGIEYSKSTLESIIKKAQNL